jgi:hypothetical protein
LAFNQACICMILPGSGDDCIETYKHDAEELGWVMSPSKQYKVT